VLLFWYYGLRGLALIFLPYAFGLQYYGLAIFAIFYGLDWIATVPPTVRLANDVFGRLAAPIVFGWIVAGHQLGPPRRPPWPAICGLRWATTRSPPS
jgi:hypothetical protein